MVLEKESSAPHSNPPRTEGGADDRLHQSDYTHGVLIDAGRWVKKNQPSPSNGRPSAASPTQGWARVLLCCVFFLVALYSDATFFFWPSFVVAERGPRYVVGVAVHGGHVGRQLRGVDGTQCRASSSLLSFIIFFSLLPFFVRSEACVTFWLVRIARSSFEIRSFKASEIESCVRDIDHSRIGFDSEYHALLIPLLSTWLRILFIIFYFSLILYGACNHMLLKC